jgi:hypothetical protein
MIKFHDFTFHEQALLIYREGIAITMVKNNYFEMSFAKAFNI